jgi:catechol 2,3-dioxygenase-like lactoylglutathione lyase family enzyme
MNFTQVQLPAKDVDAQAVFYGNLLGLPTLHRSAGEVHFQVGRSRLVFVKLPSPQPLSHGERGYAPQHFAFNIPEHRIDDAKTWLQARCDVVPDEAGNDVIYSQNWHSHGLYFYDGDGNIGELIARHTQPTPHTGAFDASALLCVSEVGIVTADPAATATLACERLSAMVYRDTVNDTFVPVGDEDGLLIIVKAGRRWMPDRVLPARVAPITVAIAGAPQFNLTQDVHVTVA